MDKLGRLIDNLKKINVILISKQVFDDTSLQNRITDYIQKDVQDGTWRSSDNQILRTDNSRKTKLAGQSGRYARKTERIKKTKSGISSFIDRVTLTDSGEMWTSKKLETFETGFKIDANFDKEGGNIADNFKYMDSNEQDFKDDILRIRDENQDQVIIPILRIKGLEIIKQTLFT
jgi:hypothetical protein